MELSEMVVWLLQGGGAGIVTYWLMERISYLASLPSEHKRYVSLILTGALAVVAFFIAVALGYETQPETVRVWVETIFSIVAVALNVSLVVHGRQQLRNK